MIKDSLKQYLRDKKEYLKYLKYKNTLPNNPMHDDIYIVEFPKSGVTWLQHILGNIELQIIDLNENVTYYNVHKYISDIHQLRGSNIRRFLNRTFIKSHSKYNPYYYFVIYLVRNPIDVMVSYYNFMLAHGYNKSFFTFVKDNSYGIMAWKKHINSWMYNRVDAQRIHLLKYENLLINPVEEIKKLYINLGVNIKDEIFEKAVFDSSLETMKENEELYKLYNPNYRGMNFVGKSGKIKKQEIMTDNIQKYILDITDSERRYLGY